MNRTLSVFGLGKLGLSMLVSFASKGWKVIGVDVNKSYVQKISQGISPIEEPQVPFLLNKYKKNITVTTDPSMAVEWSSASFVIVPTPSMENGKFTTKYVQEALESIATCLQKKKSYHLIIITSTVLPGDTALMSDIIERISGKKLNVDFGLCYNPDFIALGKVVSDFLNPDMVLIGQSDDRAGKALEAIHRSITDNKPEVFRMGWHNAELAKISLNTYLTMKISYANMIAEICENMPGGDAGIVLKAIGSDTRVGKKFFRGGMAMGGPCLPRDSRAFCQASSDMGVAHLICSEIKSYNEYHKKNRISDLLKGLLDEKGSNRLAVLGLSYKEDTPVIEESVPIEVIKVLSGYGVDISAYDPKAMDNAKKELEGVPGVIFADSMLSCLKDRAVCFIAAPWSEFGTLTVEQIKAHMSYDSIIFDACGVLYLPEGRDIDIRRIGKKHEA